MMKVLRKYYLETKKSFVAARTKSQNCRTDYLMMRKEVNELGRNAMEAELAAKVAREKGTYVRINRDPDSVGISRLSRTEKNPFSCSNKSGFSD